MEYQSFFLVLKSFIFKDDQFISNNSSIAQGFVQVKKSGQNFSLTIQINNFKEPAVAYLVSKTNVAKISLTKATTTTQIDFVIEKYASVFISGYNFYAGQNQMGLKADYLLAKNVENHKKNSTLEKIFGQVYDTYFFDCIKPKLAGLFAVGKPCNQLGNLIANSKWTIVEHNGQQMVFGVVYKDKFAYAVAVGATSNFLDDKQAVSYTVDNKTFNILFMSASTGKFISF